jgi:acyl-CoA thioesterase II
VPDLWSDLLACLDLHPVPSGGTGEAHAGDDVTEFEGRNQQLDYHRVFGGQLLGQFLRIACLTFPDKAVKSQHAVFTREGRADEPIRYQATRQHEGRSFANVTITARQSRGVVAMSSICMHTHEGGPEHQSVDEVPDVLGADREVALDLIPWETRAAVDLNVTTTGPPQFEVWMRTPAVDSKLAPALAAYPRI